MSGEKAKMVRCGDCRFFVREGRCDAEQFGPNPPFWVWSDCYSDREQVRADVMSACPAFSEEAALHPQGTDRNG